MTRPNELCYNVSMKEIANLKWPAARVRRIDVQNDYSSLISDEITVEDNDLFLTFLTADFYEVRPSDAIEVTIRVLRKEQEDTNE